MGGLNVGWKASLNKSAKNCFSSVINLCFWDAGLRVIIRTVRKRISLLNFKLDMGLLKSIGYSTMLKINIGHNL